MILHDFRSGQDFNQFIRVRWGLVAKPSDTVIDEPIVYETLFDNVLYDKLLCMYSLLGSVIVRPVHGMFQRRNRCTYYSVVCRVQSMQACRLRERVGDRTSYDGDDGSSRLKAFTASLRGYSLPGYFSPDCHGSCSGG